MTEALALNGNAPGRPARSKFSAQSRLHDAYCSAKYHGVSINGTAPVSLVTVQTARSRMISANHWHSNGIISNSSNSKIAHDISKHILVDLLW